MSGTPVEPWSVIVKFRGGVDIADIFDHGARVCTIPGSTSVGSKQVEAKAQRIAALPVLEDALRQIANGNGAYGAQAVEYKNIARAALGMDLL